MIRTPIRFMMKKERIMKMRPVMAEVMIDWPTLILSGIPAEVVIMRVPTRIRSRAIPPPRPTVILIRLIKNLPLILVEKQPRAVLISPSSQVPRGDEVRVGVGELQVQPPDESQVAVEGLVQLFWLTNQTPPVCAWVQVQELACRIGGFMNTRDSVIRIGKRNLVFID